MNRKMLGIFAIALLTSWTIAEGPSDFRSRFLSVATNDVEFGMGEASIREWGLENGSWTRDSTKSQIISSVISSMSNQVDEAVSMIPEVITNGLQRELFFHMAGHAGTNVFLRVWDDLLDIAETNAVAIPPATIDSFCTAGTTPLDCYVVFFHEISEIHLLLERTRDLFPSNSQRRVWYERTLSGAVESEMRTYLIDSGEGLPWFAQ